MAVLAPPTLAQEATPSGAIAGLFDVGGRSLHIACSGHEAPTVVIEIGLDAAPGSWAFIKSHVDDDARTCIISRASIGASDPAPEEIRTAADAVSDLSALLDEADVPGPYLLVGHSFGGMVARLFASTHPDQAAGLVLVEAIPPGFYESFFAQFPNEAEADRAFLEGANLERIDLLASAAEVRALPAPAVPAIVLVEDPMLVGDGNDPIEVLWQAAQAAQAAELGARLLIVEGSGHEIHRDAPNVVLEAIRSILLAVRDPSSWAMPEASPTA